MYSFIFTFHHGLCTAFVQLAPPLYSILYILLCVLYILAIDLCLYFSGGNWYNQVQIKHFITILMSSLASITLTVIVVVIVLIIVCLLCHYKKKSKKLKCRHIRERKQFELRKEVLNQQVENVLSQMQVLQSQLHGW